MIAPILSVAQHDAHNIILEESQQNGLVIDEVFMRQFHIKRV